MYTPLSERVKGHIWMLKIGTFSKLCRVPIKTLRYYDEIGLLAPMQIDP